MPNLSKADKAAKITTHEARRRKELALAELREMERDRRRGELVPAADVKTKWAAIAGRIRDAVLRIPNKCAPAVAAAADAREARAILEAECENILRVLSDDVEAIKAA